MHRSTRIDHARRRVQDASFRVTLVPSSWLSFVIYASGRDQCNSKRCVLDAPTRMINTRRSVHFVLPSDIIFGLYASETTLFGRSALKSFGLALS